MCKFYPFTGSIWGQLMNVNIFPLKLPEIKTYFHVNYSYVFHRVHKFKGLKYPLAII